MYVPQRTGDTTPHHTTPRHAAPHHTTHATHTTLSKADYFRDPEKVDGDAYKTYSQLAKWNNEAADSPDATINANFGLVQKWAMIKAEGDSMIFPNEGEWWGKFDGAFDKVGVCRCV